MAAKRKPGPLCQVLHSPVVLDDGTLCRCRSPLPGPIQEEPEMSDHFIWPVGVDTSKPLEEEAWFEKRYPNLIEDARLQFVDAINSWVNEHWGDPQYKDQKQRINVSARDTFYRNVDGSLRKVKKTEIALNIAETDPKRRMKLTRCLVASPLTSKLQSQSLTQAETTQAESSKDSRGPRSCM